MFLKALILNILLAFAALALTEKWGFWSWVLQRAQKNRWRLLWDLAQCDLCKTFWLSVFILSVMALFIKLDAQHLAIPFCAVGAFKMTAQ